jgi:ABC-2 type transport system permease protein
MTIATAYRPAETSGLSVFGELRSEWIKLRSVRSTVWSFAIIIVLSAAVSLLISTAVDFGSLPADQHNGVIAQAATFGIYFGQLIVAVLGVLVISGEYSTGMIRSTLTAVPKRIPALLAKAAVLFVTVFVVGVISIGAALAVAVPIYAAQDIHADGAIVGDLLLAALYLALTAVFALGIGTIVRSSAGGIAVALGIILLLPTVFLLVFSFTQLEWISDITPYLFSNAGTSMYSTSADAALNQGESTLVVLVWTVVTLAAGVLLLKRRDA